MTCYYKFIFHINKRKHYETPLFKCDQLTKVLIKLIKNNELTKHITHFSYLIRNERISRRTRGVRGARGVRARGRAAAGSPCRRDTACLEILRGIRFFRKDILSFSLFKYMK